MLLGVITVGRIWQHHLVAIRAFRTSVRATPIPRDVIVLTISALLYMLAVGIWLFVAYGEGGPEYRDGQEVWLMHGRVTKTLPTGSVAAYASRELRLFSAAWLFFALALAWAGHVTESRLHAYREARRAART
jgi:hypothetical protein